VATFTFELPQGTLEFSPGQYLVMHIPPDARRIFSLVNVPGSSQFEFLAKIIPGGVASEYFLSLREGAAVEFAGPAGVFKMRQSPTPKLFIATGTGIAPILAIVRHHLKSGPQQKFTLLWGLKSRADIYCQAELESLTKRYPNFSYFLCLSREASIDVFALDYRDNIVLGRVNKKLDGLLKNHEVTAATHEFYISGDRNIVEDLRQHLLAAGIAKEQISFEKFV
jgi:ferredoxin-NADP reductase